MEPIKISVGQPLPFTIEHTGDGGVIGFDSTGCLHLVVRFTQPTKAEQEIFSENLTACSFYEDNKITPIPIMIFNWPKPFGKVEAVIDAKLEDPEVIRLFLDNSDGVKNALSIYLIDEKNIVCQMKMIGLDCDMVGRLQDTVKKQLTADYTQSDFAAAYNSLCEKNTDDIYAMSEKYPHAIK